MGAVIRINHHKGVISFPLITKIGNIIKGIIIILFLLLFIIMLLMVLFLPNGQISIGENINQKKSDQKQPTIGPNGYYYSNTTKDGIRSIEFRS